MSEKNEPKGKSGRSYRLLLVFILAFQGIIATGWIAFENYTAWSATPENEQFISLLTSALGLLIIVVAWVLLIGSENEAHQTMHKQQEEVQHNREQVRLQEDSLYLVNTHLAEATSETSLEVMLKKLARTASAELDADTCGFWLMKENDDYQCLTQFERSADSFVKGKTISAQEQPAFTNLLKADDKVQSASIYDDQRLRELPETDFVKENQNHSLVLMPMFFRSRKIGFTWFARNTTGLKWAEHRRQMIEITTSLAAIMIGENEQLKYEGTLQEAQRRFGQLMGNSASAIARFDLPMPFSFTATRSEQIEKLQNQALLADANEVFLQHFGASKQQTFAQALQDGEPAALLHRLLDTDYQPVKTSYSTTSDKKTNWLLAITGIVENNDIKGLWLLAMEAGDMLEQKNMPALVAEQADSMLLVADWQNQIVFDNLQARRNLSLAADTRQQPLLPELVLADDQQAVSEALQQARLEQRKVVAHAVKLRQEHGGELLTEAVFTPLGSGGQALVLAEFREVAEVLHREEALLAERDFLRMLAETGNHGTLVVTLQGEQVYSNGVTETLLNYPAGALPPGINFIEEKDRPILTEALQQAAESRQAQENSLLAVNAAGEEVPVQAFIYPHPSEKEQLLLRLQVQSVVKPAQQQPGKQLETLMNRAPRVYFMTTSAGLVLAANAPVTKMLQHAPEGLKGESLLKLVHPNELPALQSNLQFLETNPHLGMQMNLHLRRQDGSWANCDIAGYCASQQHEACTFIFEVEEVTAHSKTSSDVAFRARFYNSLISGMSSGLVFVDEETRIKYTNPALKNMLGYQLKDELVHWVHSEEKDKLAREVGRTARSSDHKAHLQFRLMDKEGNWLTFAGKTVNTLKFSTFKGVLIELRPVQPGTLQESPAREAAETSLAAAVWKEQPRQLLHLLGGKQACLLLQMELSGRITEAEGDIAAIFGGQEESIAGTWFDELLHKSSLDTLAGVLEKLQQQPRTLVEEDLCLIRPDGSTRTFDASFMLGSQQEAILLVLKEKPAAPEQRIAITPAKTNGEKVNASLHNGADYATALSHKIIQHLDEPVYEISRELAPLKNSFLDMKELLDRYSEIQPETDIAPKLQEISRIKAEIDLERLFGNTSSQLDHLQQYAAVTNKLVEELKSITGAGVNEPEMLNLNAILENVVRMHQQDFYARATLQFVPETENWMHGRKLELYQLFGEAMNFLSQQIDRPGTVKLLASRTDGQVQVIITENCTGSEFASQEHRSELQQEITWQNLLKKVQALKGQASLGRAEEEGLSVSIQLPRNP